MIKLNGTKIEFGQFPNGETNVGKIGECRFLQTITLKYESDADLIHLMFVQRHLKTISPSNPTKLVITYMPYSRMDRVEGDSVFTLKYIAEFINSLGFSEVLVVEPHSDVTPAVLNNCKTVFPSIDIFHEALTKTCFDREKDYVYFPDAGAEKRYSKLLAGKFNQLVGFKHRDFETGKIVSLEVLGKVKEKGFKVIIIDDLCSYGGTALLGAKTLRELGASEIHLVVGHAENSMYLGDIFSTQFIDKVFTTDSILEKPEHNLLENRLTIYGLNSKGEIDK